MFSMTIAPETHYLLGFNFNGQYFAYTSLPMGLKSSCKIVEIFSSALVARRQLSTPFILHMIDDCMILFPSKIYLSFTTRFFSGVICQIRSSNFQRKDIPAI